MKAPLFLLLFVLFAECSSSERGSDGQQIPRDGNYPSHCWTPAAPEGKPDWEILPQEAGPGEVILSKRNELGLLSNFVATPFEFRGKRYASLEGFWHLMLYPEGKDDPRAAFPGLNWAYTGEQVSANRELRSETCRHTG